MTDRRADCIRIAEAAGELLRSRFGDPGEVRAKSSGEFKRYDVVTEVDVLAEQLVLRGIAEVAPDAFVLAEEGGLTTPTGESVDLSPADAEELWLVDPLDGTINFAHDIPHFAVSVACWRGGEPAAGAIVDPMVGETFSFERSAAGSAAFHGDRQVRIDPAVTPADSIVYIGSAVRRQPEVIARFRGCRQVASAALALAWTGVGRTGAYIQSGGLSPWDWAVGVPFVQAAGGVVTDEDCIEWPAPLDRPTGLVAAAPAVHAELAAPLAPDQSV